MSFLPVEEFKPKNKSLVYKAPKNKSLVRTNDDSESNTSFKYCPPMDEPVPDDWIVLENDLAMVLTINVPLFGQDMIVAPNKRLDDGYFILCFINGQVTRYEFLKIFIESGTGNFLDHSCMEWAKVKAFRLEPKSSAYSSKSSNFEPNDGALMVDGERVEYGNIQAEIIPGLGNVLTRKDL